MPMQVAIVTVFPAPFQNVRLQRIYKAGEIAEEEGVAVAANGFAA